MLGGVRQRNLESTISDIENLIILNKLRPEDHLLFLYPTPGINKFDTFFSFLQTGQENNELAAYISLGYADREIKERFKQLQTKEKCRVYFGACNTKRINQRLKELYKQVHEGQSTLRLVVDYDDMPKLNCEDTIKIEENIYEKKGENPLISVMSAFPMTSIDPKTFSALLKFHQNVLIQAENKSTAIVYNGEFGENKESSLSLTSRKTIEKTVKDNLRLLILGILNKGEMSGYDLIKSIHKKFKFKISPGTMYPLLFSMKKEGLIEIKKDEKDLKRKTYTLTGEGKKVTDNELLDFLTARKYLSDLIQKRKQI